jgi:hypothetical protein
MTRLLSVVCVLTVSTAVTLAAELQDMDLLTGAIDPFNEGIERAKFLKAAGVDTEMTEDEFRADQRRADGFVRSFDQWPLVNRFDDDRNGAISWFEALRYRRAIFAVLLEQHDENSDGMLNKFAERRGAAEAVAAGKLASYFPALEPRLALRSGLDIARNAESPLRRGEAILREAEANLRAAQHAGATEKRMAATRRYVAVLSEAVEAERRKVSQYDLDGDEHVSPAEWRAVQERKVDRAISEQLATYDRNRNGRIDQDEYETYRSDRNQSQMMFFDFDRDGMLNPDETRAWESSSVYNRWARFDASDANRDGILDVDEQQTFFELSREERARPKAVGTNPR